MDTEVKKPNFLKWDFHYLSKDG